MGWPNEPHRHALARRGIRTRAIENPYAGPDRYDPKLYDKLEIKRKFRGSGLENINSWDVLGGVDEFLYEFDGSKEMDQGRLIDYYYMFEERFRDFDMSFEEFEKLYEEDRKLFDVKAIYIFGSRVTGYWTPDSDVDVYIELSSTPGITDEYLDYMADNFNDTVENYLHDENRWPMLYIDGKEIKVDIPVVTVSPPDEDHYGPMLKIWEEGD